MLILLRKGSRDGFLVGTDLCQKKNPGWNELNDAGHLFAILSRGKSKTLLLWCPIYIFF